MICVGAGTIRSCTARATNRLYTPVRAHTPERSFRATHDYARALADRRQVEVADLEAALNQRIAIRTSLAEERRAHLATLAGPIPPEPPQAHIKRPHQP